MTTLSDIRQFEVRLHSHALEWDDHPLMNELLFFLDELQYLHDDLDRLGIPNTDENHLEMTLRQRVKYLAATQKPAEVVHEPMLYIYGPTSRIKPIQTSMF
jgi:hypothetical protein